MRPKIIATDKKHLDSLIREGIDDYGFQCDFNHIDIHNITDLSYLFSDFNYTFNGDISNWDTSNVTNMSHLFNGSSFNGDISRWKVSKVTNMSYLFSHSKFNGDVSNWLPMELDLATDIFLNCVAPIPYWGKARNNKEVLKAIDSYDLSNKLNDDLNSQKVNIKKIKI